MIIWIWDSVGIASHDTLTLLLTLPLWSNCDFHHSSSKLHHSETNRPKQEEAKTSSISSVWFTSCENKDVSHQQKSAFLLNWWKYILYYRTYFILSQSKSFCSLTPFTLTTLIFFCMCFIIVTLLKKHPSSLSLSVMFVVSQDNNREPEKNGYLRQEKQKPVILT